ncbi:MAG: PKD domain-containing protein [Vicinamibacterales bacterium]
MTTSPLNRYVVTLVLAAVSTAACTMKKQEAPELSGPSEFGTSIVVAVTPDVLKQDGASQSMITVTARGPNGAPLSGVPLRAEITVRGIVTDFGKLSATSAVTGSDGRATFSYTAPLGAEFVLEESTIVSIAVTPVGNDFGNATPRFASLRLVAIGTVLPPVAGLEARFTFSPASPKQDQTVFFDASPSQAPAGNPIATYSWDFGDGSTASGRTATHSYDEPGTYRVTLTVADQSGRSDVSEPEDIEVTAEEVVAPTAVIDVSPTDPLPNTAVNFSGVRSTAAPGHQIERYQWDFGDGSPLATGSRVAHTYPREGTYTVTLTVTDDDGVQGTAAAPVPVKVPEDDSLTGRR